LIVLSLDLHPIFRNNRDIDLAMRQFLITSAASGATVVTLIPGKGSGQLHTRVMRFLDQKHVKKLYTRRETDPDNPGRILVYFT
jgi:hypothetical protein